MSLKLILPIRWAQEVILTILLHCSGSPPAFNNGKSSAVNKKCDK